MRVVRAVGQNVSPSDDGRLYDQIFTDGLFNEPSFVNLGSNNVQVGAIYGDLCGRDFTIEQMTLAVTLPEGEGETTGYIYVEIDTSSEDVISLNSALAPFTPMYEDINTNGAVAQMVLAEYTASAVAVTSVTPVYQKATAGSIEAGSVATVEKSQAVASHSSGDYILLDGKLYLVTASVAIGETFVVGTNIRAAVIGDTLSELKNGLTAANGDISTLRNQWTAYESFQGKVGGITQTFHRKRIGNIFMIFGNGTVSAPVGAGATSKRTIDYSSMAFSGILGGAVSMAMEGQTGSGLKYSKINAGTIDAYVNNPATSTVNNIHYSFIVIGS